MNSSLDVDSIPLLLLAIVIAVVDIHVSIQIHINVHPSFNWRLKFCWRLGSQSSSLDFSVILELMEEESGVRLTVVAFFYYCWFHIRFRLGCVCIGFSFLRF
jgi:hypothetical protein